MFLKMDLLAFYLLYNHLIMRNITLYFIQDTAALVIVPITFISLYVEH